MVDQELVPINKKTLARKRNKVREYLRIEGILPIYGSPLTSEQQDIDDQIAQNDFSYQETYVKNKLENLGLTKYFNGLSTRGLTPEEYKNKQKRKKVRGYLRVHGVLPPYGDPLTPEQQDILDQIDKNDYSVYEETIMNNIQSNIEKSKSGYNNTSKEPKGNDLARKRQAARAYLRGYGILPPVGGIYTPEQQIIENEISQNDFTTYEEVVESNKLRIKENLPLVKNGSNVNQKDISGNAPRHVFFRLRLCQILPPLGEETNEIHEEIMAEVKENWKGKTKSYFVVKYMNFSTPEGRLLYRTYKKHQEEGFNFNLTIEDIVIPEICPYLNIKLSTDPKDFKESYYATIDRIDSSKGYVKGNVQVISLKANSMKSSSTDEQLLQFAVNGLKLIDELNL